MAQAAGRSPRRSGFNHSPNRVFYEIMWKNMLDHDRPTGNIIERMRVLCWITYAADSHSECVIRIAFRRNQW